MGPLRESNVRTIDVQLKVRLPAQLKSWLEGRAAENNRSQTAEVVQILKQERERTAVKKPRAAK
jgi:plasmid stability protein